MTRLRILIISREPYDAPSFYRSAGPLLAFPDRYEVRFANQQLTWVDLANIDIAHFARPATPEMVGMLRFVQAAGIPVHIDYDDDLINMPPDNPGFGEYRSEQTVQAISIFAEEADLLTVSTESIRKTLGGQVVQNAYIPGFHQVATAYNEGGPTYWRGSPTHTADVYAYADAIGQHVKQLHTFGWLPFPLLDKGVECSHTADLPMLQYLAALRSIKPSLCLVPLVNNTFNRGKSNIAWLEATAAGAVTVAPRSQLPEFERSGVLMFEHLADLDWHDLPALWAASRAAALEQTKTAHERRYVLLQGLVGRSSAHG